MLNKIKDSYWFKEGFDFLISLIIALIIVIPFRYFIAEPYIVQGSSMSPNFETGDYILVNKFEGTIIDPVRRGDVLVFVPPMNRKDSWRNYFPIIDGRMKYIKRVIGLPGEEVKIENHKAWIKKKEWKEFRVLKEPYLKNTNLRIDQVVKLKNDEYFMLGDNRGNSYDSEEWGPIKKTDIIGEPFLRLFPFSKFGYEPSNHKFDF